MPRRTSPNRSVIVYDPGWVADCSASRDSRESWNSRFSTTVWRWRTRSTNPVGSMRRRISGSKKNDGVVKTLSFRNCTASACLARGTGWYTLPVWPAYFVN